MVNNVYQNCIVNSREIVYREKNEFYQEGCSFCSRSSRRNVYKTVIGWSTIIQ